MLYVCIVYTKRQMPKCHVLTREMIFLLLDIRGLECALPDCHLMFKRHHLLLLYGRNLYYAIGNIPINMRTYVCTASFDQNVRKNDVNVLLVELKQSNLFRSFI